MSVLYKIIALVKNIINETARLFGKAVAINSMHTDSMQMELPTHVDALQWLIQTESCIMQMRAGSFRQSCPWGIVVRGFKGFGISKPPRLVLTSNYMWPSLWNCYRNKVWTLIQGSCLVIVSELVMELISMLLVIENLRVAWWWTFSLSRVQYYVWKQAALGNGRNEDHWGCVSPRFIYM